SPRQSAYTRGCQGSSRCPRRTIEGVLLNGSSLIVGDVERVHSRNFRVGVEMRQEEGIGPSRRSWKAGQTRYRFAAVGRKSRSHCADSKRSVEVGRHVELAIEDCDLAQVCLAG